MTARRRPIDARIDTALQAWRGLGLPIGALVIGSDGSVRLEVPVDKMPEPAQDQRKPEPWTK